MTKKFLFVLSLIIFSGLAARSYGQNAAAGPQVLLTWKAHTYVPPGFSGKVLPTANSPVTASVELIDGGKIADISGINVYWYQDDEFLAGGRGLRRVALRTPAIMSGSTALRVEMPNYPKGRQLKTVDIPLVRPRAVIEYAFPSEKFSSSPLKLVGQPYFFNAGNLSLLNFAWSVNGQTPSGTESPQNLDIKFNTTMPRDSVLSVSLSIQNTDSRFDVEAASKNIDLTYSP